MRLEIRPGLAQVWRAPGRLQIGLDAGHGVILDGLSAGDERLVAALDGTLDLEGLLRRARRLGVRESRARALLAVLRRAGVLVPSRTNRARLGRIPEQARSLLRPDAATLAVTYPSGDGWDVLVERRSRRAAVVGLGRAGLAVAGGLARAGVGTVVLDDDRRVRECDLSPGGYGPQDVGRLRVRAAADVIARGCPHTRTSATGDLRPDLLVLVGHRALDPRRTQGLLREDVAHLAVVLRERDAVVGPLVRPGRSACLRCLDLHRRDRDPEWPRLVAQLSVRSGEGDEETVLAAMAGSLACAQALAQLDGRVEPASLDATLEVALPDGLVAVRPWSSHPECGCRWPPRRTGRSRAATMGP